MSEHIDGIRAAEIDYLKRVRHAAANGWQNSTTSACETSDRAQDGATQWHAEQVERETEIVDMPIEISSDNTPNDEMDPPDDW